MQAKATAAPTPGFRGHETRDTKHESRLFIDSRLFCRLDALPGIAHVCPALPTIARLHRGRMATASSASWMHLVPAQPSLSREQEPPPTNTAREPRPPRPPGFRVTRHESRHLGARRKPARIPSFSRNTKHETRITAFSAAPSPAGRGPG